MADRDLRTRVVAVGLPAEVAIAQVMSAPARRVTPDLTAETVLRNSALHKLDFPAPVFPIMPMMGW